MELTILNNINLKSHLPEVKIQGGGGGGGQGAVLFKIGISASTPELHDCAI